MNKFEKTLVLLIAQWRRDAKEAMRYMHSAHSCESRARLATEAKMLERCARELEDNLPGHLGADAPLVPQGPDEKTPTARAGQCDAVPKHVSDLAEAYESGKIVSGGQRSGKTWAAKMIAAKRTNGGSQPSPDTNL